MPLSSTPSNDETTLALRVREASRIAADIQLFELVHPEGVELPEFTAGAHLLVRVPSGLTRRYSLCNAPQDRDRYVIAVKRESNGRGGSVSLVDGTKVGDTQMSTYRPVRVNSIRASFTTPERR